MLQIQTSEPKNDTHAPLSKLCCASPMEERKDTGNGESEDFVWCHPKSSS